MRPRSMTGFGRGEAVFEGRTWIAEVRTVNHRFLDLRIILPRPYAALEDRVRSAAAAHHDRGRVEISLQLQGEEAGGLLLLAVNTDLARQYHRCLQQLNDEFGLDDKVRLADMLTLRDLISQQDLDLDPDREWHGISAALDRAFEECRRMREQEGRLLKEDLAKRLADFAATVGAIEQQLPEILQQRQDELKRRITRLLDGVDLDPMRLAQETAILADKCDVTEELVRLRSHISQFTGFLDSDEPVGRRLDFLLQEFLREVNTLASKINNAGVAYLNVEMKNEIEKLREQVQNLE
ncbi:UPF0701 protein YloC [hydrothermal vent metagenome]|uniref:UPF0701 protein YloC n=1 Tax=hydrothermal vent metagenome TaxID=652676 RepID=A0A3B0W730_9ZZZZ